MLRSVGYVHASYINYVNVDTKLRTSSVRSLVSNNIDDDDDDDNNNNIKTDLKKSRLGRRGPK
jgi:hypothetical protein